MQKTVRNSRMDLTRDTADEIDQLKFKQTDVH